MFRRFLRQIRLRWGCLLHWLRQFLGVPKKPAMQPSRDRISQPGPIPAQNGNAQRNLTASQGKAIMDARQLLSEISGCEIARSHVQNPNRGGPCSEIVATQNAESWAEFQVPEPWSGYLLKAPILFLSSNPSISNTEAYPMGPSDDSHRWNFFDNRFDGYWIQNGNRPRNQDNTYGRAVPYWSGIRNRATELLGRDAIPGLDYALSEIVHCKSQREEGVQAAINACATRYLFRLLSCASATVLVLVGRKALAHWNSLNMNPSLPRVPDRDGTDPQQIAGRLRRVVFLGHPTSAEPKLFSHWVCQTRMEEIRTFIRNA